MISSVIWSKRKEIFQPLFFFARARSYRASAICCLRKFTWDYLGIPYYTWKNILLLVNNKHAIHFPLFALSFNFLLRLGLTKLSVNQHAEILHGSGRIDCFILLVFVRRLYLSGNNWVKKPWNRLSQKSRRGKRANPHRAYYQGNPSIPRILFMRLA